MKRILLLALPLMTACRTPAAVEEPATPITTTPTAALDANHWRLASATDKAGNHIDALFVRADKPVTLDFDDGHLWVANTCNRLSGSYTLQGSELNISPMASTMMACADPVLMALDQAIGDRLAGTLRIEQRDASLRLVTTAGDVLTFRGEPTAETRYGGEGDTVFLEVDARTLPCSSGVMQARCLQVREVHYDGNGLEQGTRGAYENFHGSIEGYAHQPGVRNLLRVKRYTVKNPPADGSSLAYVLDMVVSTETVQP